MNESISRFRRARGYHRRYHSGTLLGCHSTVCRQQLDVLRAQAAWRAVDAALARKRTARDQHYAHPGNSALRAAYIAACLAHEEAYALWLNPPAAPLAKAG